ncbi:hypothetical protein [Pontibacter brevis]
MKNLLLLCFLLTLIACDNQVAKSNTETARQVDSYKLSDTLHLKDFEVVYDDNGKSNFFSSSDSAFSRKYMGEVKRVSVALTVEEKRRIYNVIKKEDILTLPDTIERGDRRCILPSFSTEIIVRIGQMKKRVYDNGFCEINDKNVEERFLRIEETIRGIINNKEEVRSLPASNRMYM